MRRITVIALSLVFLGSALVGCSQERKPVLARTGQIPLKVWVILGPGESIGGGSNRGCRLTTNEMQDRIAHLKNHAYIYGSNIIFQWTPITPPIAQDPALLPFQPRSRDWMDVHQDVIANYWEADHLNIYFAGNVQINGQNQNAFTTDPALAAQLTPDFPYIVCNDGGFTQSSGFVVSASQMTSYNVIEHEMTHYLLRRSGVPPYNSGEHSPSGSNNILRDGGAPPAYPLVVPGRWNSAGTEQKEIWDRVFAGVWNNP
jgi:hypothetical protein